MEYYQLEDKIVSAAILIVQVMEVGGRGNSRLCTPSSVFS